MAKLHAIAGGVVAALLAAAVVALPADAQHASMGPDPNLPAVAPPIPAPQPGETHIPPVGTAAEDDMPRSRAVRRRVLRELRRVAACVRSQGIEVPDPVSDGDGVHLSWSGPPRPAAEAAIERCRAAGG